MGCLWVWVFISRVSTLVGLTQCALELRMNDVQPEQGMLSPLSGSNFLSFPGWIWYPRMVHFYLPLLVSQCTQHTAWTWLINLRGISIYLPERLKCCLSIMRSSFIPSCSSLISIYWSMWGTAAWLILNHYCIQRAMPRLRTIIWVTNCHNLNFCSDSSVLPCPVFCGKIKENPGFLAHWANAPVNFLTALSVI
jgi:hypothetical protein